MPIKPKTISFVSFESLTTSVWYNFTVLDLIPSPIITYFDMHKTSQCWSQSQKCCHNQYIGHNCKGISHKKKNSWVTQTKTKESLFKTEPHYNKRVFTRVQSCVQPGAEKLVCIGFGYKLSMLSIPSPDYVFTVLVSIFICICKTNNHFWTTMSLL